MTHPLVTKCLAAQAEVDSIVALLKGNSKHQIDIMKELIERADMPEIKLDKRFAGLFSYDYIEIEVSSAGRASFSVWEDAYADIPEENVGEFDLSEHILDGRDDDFRLEYEAYVARIAEAFRERAWIQRDAEIARARATLDQLERQREAIIAHGPIRIKS
jgi:hypothetical protein